MKNVAIMRTQAVNKKLIFHSVLICIATFQEKFLAPRLVHNLKVSFPSRCVLYTPEATYEQILNKISNHIEGNAKIDLKLRKTRKIAYLHC